MFNASEENRPMLPNPAEITSISVSLNVPSFVLSSPDFKGSRINGAFTAEEYDFVENCGADYWIYGHSHRNIDGVIGKTQCVSNQLGYVFSGEHKTFDPGRYIEC